MFGLGISLSSQALLQEALVILHVTVMDTTGTDAAPDQTVVITGGRISAMGKAGAVGLPDNAADGWRDRHALDPGIMGHAHPHTAEGKARALLPATSGELSHRSAQPRKPLQ